MARLSAGKDENATFNPPAEGRTGTVRLMGTGVFFFGQLGRDNGYRHFQRWRDKPWRRRGAAYEEYKEQISQRLLAHLLRYAPQLSGKIVHRELSTPLSTENFTNYSGGPMYGMAHSPERYVQCDFGPRTHVAGLYLTGQDVASVGVVGALISGAITAGAIAGPRLIRHLIGQ